MSGGHFNHNQGKLTIIAETIESEIRINSSVHHFSPETIKEFEQAVTLLRTAYVYVQRIDWLLSADDSEETFHKRLQEELKEE
jgi:hypothetical protein